MGTQGGRQGREGEGDAAMTYVPGKLVCSGDGGEGEEDGAQPQHLTRLEGVVVQCWVTYRPEAQLKSCC